MTKSILKSILAFVLYTTIVYSLEKLLKFIFINEFLEAFKKPEFVASFKLRNQYLKGEITHTPEALDIYQYQSRFNVLN